MLDFVQAWASALAGVVHVPLPPDERRRVLAELTARLRKAATGEPFSAEEGRRIGGALVRAGFNTPEVLGRTLTLVNSHLTSTLELPLPIASSRLDALMESFATGFTAAVRDRALDEQEAVRLAAMQAHVRAEAALRASEEKFQYLASHDPVTGLPNRAQFTQRLADRLGRTARSDRFAICCLDLDRFAGVNDSLGYPAGDQLLQAVADRLRTLVAPAGWLVARLESDQFAVLAEPLSGSEDPAKVADRLLTALSQPFQLEGFELPLTSSIGMVEGPNPSWDSAELLQAAQIALHWAKADGRARWRQFRVDRAAAESDRYRLSADMPKGLRHDEFGLDYQPLVELGTGRLVGLEALARWQHPVHGRLTAERFIGLAEHTALVVPLGNQLLAQACWQASQWQALPDPPYVSVNLSAAELHQPGLVGYFAQIIDRYDLNPDRLQVEITEHAIGNAHDIATTLEALGQLGVRIAIDDFGTGYSNLARLRDLPLHVLKLDATFAQHHDPDQPLDATAHNEFIAAVVGFGHTLGLTVTAEGIETAAHAERMYRAGCDTGQGWHFGHPQQAHRLQLASVG